jgi:nucleoside phosphorylase
MKRARFRIEDYTVGWVCALPIELAAATATLDEDHQDLPQGANDSNLYTLGRIGEHNVVVACMPVGQMGTNSAAAVAVQMKSKFGSIRFGLMVGIGGGVPNAESDVRLGDVVVSQPNMEHGGVVQYDFGKATPCGFERTGFLNAPPTILLNSLARLQANHSIGRSSLSIHLSTLSHLPLFAQDNIGPDVLFESSYNHISGTTCENCDKNRLVKRTLRGSPQPVVHYGTIASGNQVIRDGITRDRLSSELGSVLCFEMEAAGLMNSFPCLVIRGICDYADSHKNKMWQHYAAATAAACATEVLSVMPAAEVATTHAANEAIMSVR